MSKKPVRGNPKVTGAELADKFKNMPKGANLAGMIPDNIWEILSSNGIIVPEKIKEAFKKYQSN
jgi:hypothetical protein